MELPIGKIIFDLRKKKGATQEQLADAVGVSVPAVSKWETGNSYPDITLLIPIARYLGVTVDDLLHYERDISPEKVLEIEKICTERFEADGFESGLALCNKYLQEYPNNLYLKYRIAYLLPWYSAKCGVKEEPAHVIGKQAAGLLTEASGSKDEKIRSASLYMLACTYIQMDECDKAQDILEKMPKNELDPDKILPTVYMQQGKLDEAIKLNQQNLLKDLNGAVMTLTNLAAIATKEKKWDDALRYANAQRKMIEAFQLENLMLDVNFNLYLTIYSRKKDAENTLLYLKQYLSSFPYDLSKLRLSHNFFFSMADTSEPSAALNFTKETIIRALEKSEEMEFLRDDTRFQNILKSFQSQP